MTDSRVLVLISGKRKSGKDFLSQLLRERLSKKWKTMVVGLSHSLKEEYASTHDLDYSELITSGEYKEKYRRDMIVWGEEIRRNDPAYFVRKALSSSSNAQIVIVSDCRRKSDMENMKDMKRIMIRVSSLLSTRLSRGFIFTTGIDDEESECGLDDYEGFHLIVQNDGDSSLLDVEMDKIESMIDQLL